MHNDQTSLKSKESSLHNNEENLDTIIKISQIILIIRLIKICLY